MSEKPGRRPTKIPPPRGPADPELGGISIIFPVCNESFIIEQTIRNYIAEFQGRVPDFEVIVAEDGSTDDTKAVLERLAEELPIKVVSSDERKGYQRGVIDALKHATKPWVFVVDSDYQFAAIDFWRLSRAGGPTISFSASSAREGIRFIGSGCPGSSSFILRFLFRVPYRDMDTGFRLMRRSVVEEIVPQLCHLSTFTAEFVVRAHYAGHGIREVPVHHYARKIGSTTIYFISSLFFICFEQFMGILKMRREFTRRGLKPPLPKSAAVHATTGV